MFNCVLCVLVLVSQDALMQQRDVMGEMEEKVKELEGAVASYEQKSKETEQLIASKEEETRRTNEELNIKGEEIKVLQDELSRERTKKEEREKEVQGLLEKQVRSPNVCVHHPGLRLTFHH